MKLEFESYTSTIPFTGTNFADNVSSENATLKVSQMLQAGIKAAQEGNRAEARPLLLQVTEAEPENETAWLWMASISEYPEELLIFLNNVLNVNPANERALEWAKATKSLLAKTFVQRGIDASNEANMDFAKQCFLQAIVHDSESEMAWLWLASIADSSDEKIAYLQKVLSLNPENETAKTSLQAATNQVSQSLLRKANSAAVAGMREEASEMLEEIFRHTPDLEEAWILKSYLAESFSEKITCFEKVLTLNPENVAANSGLASLREMMAKTENRRAEQAAFIESMTASLPNPAQADFDSSDDDSALTEDDKPTQKLEFPPDFLEAQKTIENPIMSENQIAVETENIELFDGAKTDHADYSDSPQEVAPPPPIEENVADERWAAAAEVFENFSSNAEVSFDENKENKKEFFAPAEENFSQETIVEETSSKSNAELMACPFCHAENESNAFVCQSCRTILTLSNLEMLLAHTGVDSEILRQAVERMESEKTGRDFELDELKTLAIGQINLKNLRGGILNLQAALRMNPNDVMLGSQVNSLKIRLSEIEQQESIHSSMTRGKKIMVVDDSATVRKLISSKLEKSGHEVVCAVDGIDALEKIKEFVPDLILLDIMMPRMDGYQVCKLIRTNEETKDVPIVMISGNDGFFDKVRGRMSGTTGYITKPFGPEALMKTIETYIV